ncbi:MAG: peptidylprolyl isomerase [Bdellovibrionales bacterium]
MKMKLSHILVEQRYEAEDLIRKLADGEPFEKLAQKFSKCPSSQRGGSLGEIELKRLDPDFAAAAETLKAGQISEVVKTRFGHHLIRRE